MSAKVAPDPVLDAVIESAVRFFLRRPSWRANALRRHTQGIDGRCQESSCGGAVWPCLSAFAAGQALRRSKHQHIPLPRRSA